MNRSTAHTSVAAQESAFEISLALDNGLCFAMYATSRLVAAAYRPFLDRMGVTYPRCLVLLAPWEQPGSSMKQLCARLSLNYGTVSALVERLVTADLVDRDPGGADKREVVLRPTAASRALEDQVRCMIETVAVDVGLSPQDPTSGTRSTTSHDVSPKLPGCGQGVSPGIHTKIYSPTTISASAGLS